MNKPTLTKADLRQFTSTENYWVNPMFRRWKYTDGVKYVADVGEAHWLLDVIFSHQFDPKAKAEEFQVWTLKKVANTSGCTVTMTDGNSKTPIIQQEIEYTDFPLDEIQMWMEGDVLILPSEH